jgi:hypothetical protein
MNTLIFILVVYFILSAIILTYREILIKKVKKNAIELTNILQDIHDKNNCIIKPLMNDHEKKFFNLLFPAVRNKHYIVSVDFTFPS